MMGKKEKKKKSILGDKYPFKIIKKDNFWHLSWTFLENIQTLW